MFQKTKKASEIPTAPQLRLVHLRFSLFFWGWLTAKKQIEILSDKLEQCGKANVRNHFGIVYYWVYHITTLWSFYHNFFLPGLWVSISHWLGHVGQGQKHRQWLLNHCYIWHYDVLQCG